MKKTFKVADLQNARGNETLREYKVSNSDYERFETYVHSSGLALARVKAIGDLHFNIIRSSGEVERCNRLAVFTGLSDGEDYFVYLCDHDALNPPKVGRIVDLKLSLIDSDSNFRDFYWAESITPIDENVEINYVSGDYRL